MNMLHPFLRHYMFLLVFLFSTSTVKGQQTVGLFLNTAESFNGYTLFAPTLSTNTYLIDNCGEVINSWESDYRPGASAYLLENGNLLRTARIQSNTFLSGGIGGRLELFSWEGTLLWQYNFADDTYHQHHDIAVLPNGNILILAWEFKTNEEAIQAGRRPELLDADDSGFWPEIILEVEMVGTDEINVLWEWRLWDHLIQDHDESKDNFGVIAEHPELLDINLVGVGGVFGGYSDWLHANSIDYNAELDQIVIGSRHLSELYIIDHSINTIDAVGPAGDFLYRWGNSENYDRGESPAQRLFGQHHVSWIPDPFLDGGKIMIFNNGEGRPTGDFSSIDVIDPPLLEDGTYAIDNVLAFEPDTAAWTYTAPGFFAPRLSSAERLPNGNTFICSGNEGLFFEIDTSGNIVWEYINPVNSQGPMDQGVNTSNNDVFRASRYFPDYPAFADRTLEPGGVIENDPNPAPCDLFMNPTSANNLEGLEGIHVLTNPFRSVLSIKNESQEALDLEILDLTGKRIFARSSNDPIIECQSNYWQNGMYILHVFNKKYNKYSIQKIVKQ